MKRTIRIPSSTSSGLRFARWALLAMMLAASTASTGRAATVNLNVMTFNIKFDDGSIGNQFEANGWVVNKFYVPTGNRRDKVEATISSAAPDIFGEQEGLPNQVTDLKNAFPNYTYYGQGRNGGNGSTSGETNGIFYLTSRFTEVAEGDFWLSTTPTVPGTTFVGGGTDTGNPRMVSWIKLYDNQSHQTYFVADTHWSLDTQAENQSGTFMRTELAQLAGGLPMIVIGDFNTTLPSTALQTLVGATSSGFKLTDAYRHVYPTVGPNEATFHNFTGNQSGSAIDHIFYTASTFTATAAAIVHTTYNGLYPSDHFPVTATLQVTVVPEPAAIVMACLAAVGTIGLARGRFSPRKHGGGSGGSGQKAAGVGQ
ncbi:MAG TPA: endonuclease/exonuclease/phosphatase family protein [Pirellulales bacterium]